MTFLLQNKFTAKNKVGSLLVHITMYIGTSMQLQYNLYKAMVKSYAHFLVLPSSIFTSPPFAYPGIGQVKN